MDNDLVKQQIKDANDIVDVVGGYVSLRPVGPTFKGLCPFHDDHRPSFDVDPRRQRYRCWSCNKYGDVISFIQEYERVDFPEALELLARRAGITLKKRGAATQASRRALMLECVRWAAEQFHRCLLDAPAAEDARRYLGERRLTGETVRRWGLGFAPPAWDWLLKLAGQNNIALEMLETVGLIGRRTEGEGYYDRFRDRVMFPIRNPQGQTVGFGGRILPSSPLSAQAPKYYNSSETPLFSKSDLLYGLDQARQAGTTAGYLAVVEGYTDVLMAHQMGITHVVSTMGTALNPRHVQQLRRFTPRVVLVFDADAGGSTGVDRALEVFVGQEMDLAVAALPEGLDPCDLLVQQGAEPFLKCLEGAVDVFEFKLQQVWMAEAGKGVEGQRRAVDAILKVIALAPERTDQAGAVKRQLMVNRVAHRLGLQEEIVWARLHELRANQPARAAQPRRTEEADGDDTPKAGKALEMEAQLLEVLLAEPELVPVAAAQVTPEQIKHSGLRTLLEGLYALQAEGQVPTLDALRVRIAHPRLSDYALRMQERGRENGDRAAWLRDILTVFRQKYQVEPVKRDLQNQLHAAPDHSAALELLKRLQHQTAT